MKHFLQKYFWLIALHVVIVTTAIINFPVGKYFIGWDALTPEFNTSLNLSRAIFPFWQENYGLGALTGHGFAATLPHTLLISLLSIVLPEWSLRSVFTFICYYLGGIGMYFLLFYLLSKLSSLKSFQLKQYTPAISFVGALYYLFNLGTIQVFYIQLESFIGQYAALPWLFLSVFLVLDRGKKRDYLFLLLVSFAASIQGFIPSLFATYFVSLMIILFAYLATHRSRWGIGKVICVFIISLLTNIYWLLPVVYFQITRGSNFLSAYNNLSSTPHFIELSSKYGTLENVALLKSYLFDSFQLGGYILQPWISHQNSFLILFIGYGIFTVILFGILFSLLKLRSYYVYALSIIFIYVFSSIAINTFPFSLVTKLLQIISPTYEQAFRTTFTKFGISMSFLYSIELCFALFLLAQLLAYLKKSIFIYSSYIIIIISILYYALPAFSGNLLYKKLELKIPSAYPELMSYMNKQPNGRIADFPQYCSDGWYAYNWGYFGSGFLWYGIEQPFLSRSFDVWSSNNENYYWELSQALAQQDYKKVDVIFKKYHVRWVLFDPNVKNCASQKGIINNTQLLVYLENSKEYSKEKIFTKDVFYPITLLRNNSINDNTYISSQNNIKNIGPVTKWIDSDIINGTYYTSEKNIFSDYYPFRSLLTKRGQNSGSTPNISLENNTISFTTVLPKLKYYTFPLPYNTLEKMVPARFSIESGQENTYAFSLQLLFPEVKLDEVLLTLPLPKLQLGTLPVDQLKNPQVFINGQRISQNNNSYTGMLSTDSNNTIIVFEGDQVVFNWNSQSDSLFQHDIITQSDQKINDSHNGTLAITLPVVADNAYFGINKVDIGNIVPEPCNEIKPTNRNVFEVNTQQNNQYIRLLSKNSIQCIKLHFPQLLASQSYLMAITTKNISGNLPKTSLYNNGSLIYFDLSTGKKNMLTTSYYVIPPSSPSEVGYDFEFENASNSNEISVNDFHGVTLYPIPYNFIKKLSLNTNQPIDNNLENLSVITAQHPNPTSYVVSLNNKAGMLTLAQSYDSGWVAYELPNGNLGWSQRMFPFLFGKKLKDHVLVNNWENGWIIDSPTTLQGKQIVIVYLPQYLEYFGFLLLSLIPLGILVRFAKLFFFHLNHKIDSYFSKKVDDMKEKIAITKTHNV